MRINFLVLVDTVSAYRVKKKQIGQLRSVFFICALCHASSVYSQISVSSHGMSLTIATQNLFRFYDTHDDRSRRDSVLTPAAFQKKIEKTAWYISHKFGCPDIVAVQEVENINVLKHLAAEACWEQHSYAVYLLEGNDFSGMDVGFLLSKKLKVRHVRQLGLNARQKGKKARVFDRPPLLLELANTWCGIENINLVVVHNRSFKGLRNPDKSKRVHEKRMQQAAWLGEWVKSWEKSQPGGALILLGDFNALSGGEELKRLQKTATNGRRSLLNNLGSQIPEAERYFYIFRGNKQAIDHIFVTDNLASLVSDVHYTRFNTVWGSSKTRAKRISDHEGMVAKFDFSDCEVL